MMIFKVLRTHLGIIHILREAKTPTPTERELICLKNVKMKKNSRKRPLKHTIFVNKTKKMQ